MKKLVCIPLKGIKSFLSLFFLLCSIGLFAQQVSGTVKDNKGESIIGAAIVVKGTNNGTLTDVNGSFTLTNVAKGSTLVISFVGFKAQEVNAGESLAITLEAGDALDELVITGVFDP